MTDLEQLAARLVEAASVAIAEIEMSSDYDSWRPVGRASVIAVLRELAAKPDGYLRYQEDGGITYTKTLRGLADFIEKGQNDG